MNKVIGINEAVKMIKSGCTIMISGFMAVKSPEALIDLMIKNNIKNLTVIANDSAVPGKGIGKLITHRCVKKLIASHIGLNHETGRQMNAGELEVELIPQGTLAERIRCGGAGLGGFLTPTGIGTSVEEGKQKLTVNGAEYLLEFPLRADVAIIKGSVVDTLGNVFYKGTTQNFSLVMAMAADLVIVEAEEIVQPGELKAEYVMTPGIFVDYIVGAEM